MKFILTLLFFIYNAGAAPQLINGAGATFPYPIYSKWFSEYNKQNPQIQINYQSLGSGAGVRHLLSRTVDFGASDVQVTNEELINSQSPVLHIPTVLGAVVLSYNLPQIKQTLKLDSTVLSSIFLGKITKWNDPQIAEMNQNIILPATPITVIYRSDGSGTTYVFTDYLSKVNVDWKLKVGVGKSIKWPVGFGGKGNEGVAGLIKQTPGAIGYIEMIYAVKNNFKVATLKNKFGSFIYPTIENITAAAEGALKNASNSLRSSITDANGNKSYPISSYTYILVYKNMKKKIGEPLIEFLNWAMGPGQSYVKQLEYAPLPQEVIKEVKTNIKTITLY